MERRARPLSVLLALLGCASDPPAADAGAPRPDAPAPDLGADAGPPDAGGRESTVRFGDATCFQAPTSIDRAVPGDLDRDGHPDMLLEYRADSSEPDAPGGYGYARNASTAGAVRFEARVDHLSTAAAPLLPASASQVVDLDGDGFAELLRDDRWWRNGQTAAGPLTDATFTGPGRLFVSGVGFASPEPATLAVLDLDLDGLVDLASAPITMGCDVLVYPNQGPAADPSFGVQRIVRVYVRGLTRCTSLAFGDVDRDGRPDAVVTSGNVDRGSGEQGFAALRNATTRGRIEESSFEAPVRWTTAAVGERRSTANALLADFDGDGRLDLFYTLTSPDAPGARGALRPNAGGIGITADTFGPAVDLPGDLGAVTAVAAVDLDGDGTPDLAAAADDRVTTVQNLTPRGGALAADNFAARSFLLDLGGRAPTFADVDSDGRADVVFVRDGAFCVLRNLTP